MRSMTSQQLWQQLAELSLAEGEMPPASEARSPWYIRLMQGIAGWIGALFLLGFVGAALAFLVRSPSALAVTGLLVCGSAFFIFSTASRNDFAMQFGFAASLAGQTMFLFGQAEALRLAGAESFVVAALFEALLAAVMPNFIHRVASSWAAMAAFGYAMQLKGAGEMAPAIAAAGVAAAWLNEFRWPKRHDVVRPVGYGLVAALLQVEAFDFLAYGFWGISHFHGGAPWRPATHYAGALLTSVVLLGATLKLLRREGIAPGSAAGAASIAAAVALGCLSMIVPGLTAAVLVLVLGFSLGNRILVGLGLLALAAFLSNYYYQLQATLMTKSMALASSAILLLSIRVAMKAKWPLRAEGETTHA